jgi:hypothetical protein
MRRPVTTIPRRGAAPQPFKAVVVLAHCAVEPSVGRQFPGCRRRSAQVPRQHRLRSTKVRPRKGQEFRLREEPQRRRGRSPIHDDHERRTRQKTSEARSRPDVKGLRGCERSEQERGTHRPLPLTTTMATHLRTREGSSLSRAVLRRLEGVVGPHGPARARMILSRTFDIFLKLYRVLGFAARSSSRLWK